MIDTIRVYLRAIKYWLQGGSWNIAYKTAHVLIKTWKKGG